MPPAAQRQYLRISDVARLVRLSPSLLRSWENLGLVRPRRSPSGYRLYSRADLKVLKRARFLRRVRGLNAPAIVHLLRVRGRLRPDGTSRAGALEKQESGPVGLRLRNLRVKRGRSLKSVARECGISAGFLSAIERGQMTASVGTLRKLARFYRLNILDFFDAAQSNPHLVHPTQRKRLEAGPGVKMELLAWGDTVMEPHLFRIAPGAGSGEAYAHEGEEFLYLLRGQMEISLDGGTRFRLKPGDSFYFESSTPHRWANPGKTETWILWVNTPPTF
jgi:DNA-binding transcriptional MerR regulator/quercetin dioxygenase-like cupin family protein